MPRKRNLLTGIVAVVGIAGAVVVFASKPGNAPEQKLLEKFDTDQDRWLNETERKAARAEAGSHFRVDVRSLARRVSHGGGASMPTPSAGQVIEKDSVAPIEEDLYDTSVLRTIFMDFANEDWESELEDFHNTDIEVAATLTVDGETLPNCGIRFRGASSYDHVSAGHKRSFNVSVDMADEDQRLLGYKTLNLLNGHGDDTMMSTVLFSHIARQYMPAPRANFVRIVINGEDWGIYTNVEQFNKDFLKANYDSGKGARWKVHGSPRGGGGLDYRGTNPDQYEHPYEQKSGGKKAKAKMIELCRVLDQTPTTELSDALEPICDVEELLWFLALDVGLMNGDGYWVRASDYSIYLDNDDRFHVLPHDMNEAFRPVRGGGPSGPGRGRRLPFGLDDWGVSEWAFGGGRGRGGSKRGEPSENDPRSGEPSERRSNSRPEQAGPTNLDPLVAIDDADKPLRSKVLAVPEYRERYLANLRTLAEESLDWDKLQPFIKSQTDLIGDVVQTETHALSSHERFAAMTSPSSETGSPDHRRAGPRGSINLKDFLDGRREYLLKYED